MENWHGLLESWFNEADKPGRATTPSDSQQELAKLQGEWLMESREMRGQKTRDEIVKQFTLTIQGNQWIVNSTDPQASLARTTIQVDPTNNPKSIDLTMEGKEVALGIYKLEGDTLTLCRNTATGDVERPTEFKTSADGGMLIVWKRVKK